jgi:hypothetical protein
MSARITSDLPPRDEPGLSRWPGAFGLSFGLIAGPLSALAMQMIAYNGVNWACGTGRMSAVHIVPALFLALTVVALLTAIRDWMTVGRGTHATRSTVADRTRFLSLCGIILSTFSAVLIVAMWIPLVVFDPCQH